MIAVYKLLLVALIFLPSLVLAETTKLTEVHSISWTESQLEQGAEMPEQLYSIDSEYLTAGHSLSFNSPHQHDQFTFQFSESSPQHYLVNDLLHINNQAVARVNFNDRQLTLKLFKTISGDIYNTILQQLRLQNHDVSATLSRSLLLEVLNQSNHPVHRYFSHLTLSNLPNQQLELLDFESTAVTFADIDGDNDLDLVAGNAAGELRYFENQGDSQSPSYLYVDDHPISQITVAANATPTLIDIDNDNDADLFIGSNNGTVEYYKNVGSTSQASFKQQSGSSNLFYNRDMGDNSLVRFADTDGDGDLDGFVRSNSNKIAYFVNTGTANSPRLIRSVGSIEPLYHLSLATLKDFLFFDYDGDKDLDLLTIDQQNTITLFNNDGLPTKAHFRDELIAPLTNNLALPALSVVNDSNSLSFLLSDHKVYSAAVTDVLQISVSPQNDAPIIHGVSTVSLEENQTAVAEYFANDEESGQLAVNIKGDDGALFEFVDQQLHFVVPADYENPTDKNKDNHYQIALHAVDENGLTSEFPVQITVTDGNDAPIVEVQQNYTVQLSTLTVADISSFDLENDNYQLSLQGADSHLFTLSDQGALAFATAQSFSPATDANQDNTYQLEIAASDEHGNTASYPFSVTLLNTNYYIINQPSSFFIAENQQSALMANTTLLIGQLTTSLHGEDAHLFQINESGQISFINNTDFENAADSDGNNTYQITVRFENEAGESVEFAIEITVQPVNEAPKFLSAQNFEINENISTIVDVATYDDEGELVTLSLTGLDADLFKLNEQQLSFKNEANFEIPKDSNLDNIYQLNVLATDQAGNTTAQPVTITIINEQELAVNLPSTLYVNENTNLITDLPIINTGESAIEISISGPDAQKFEVNNQKLSLISAVNFEDSSVQKLFDITLSLSDEFNIDYFAQQFEIAVMDVNEAPSAVIEDEYQVSLNKLLIGKVDVIDEDGDTFQLTVAQTDTFAVDNLGYLTFKSPPKVPTNEPSKNYPVTLIATDEHGLSAHYPTTVKVFNQSQYLLTDTSQLDIYENTSMVAQFSDYSPQQQWSLSGAQASYFRLTDTGELVFVTPPDFELLTPINGTYVYNLVISTQIDGVTTTHNLSIVIHNHNEAPIINLAESISVIENQTLVTQLQGHDPENNIITWSISGEDSTLFTVNDTSLEFVNPSDFEQPFDADMNNHYQISLIASDGQLSTEQAVTVSINNQQELEFTNPASISVAENQLQVSEFSTNHPANFVLSGEDQAQFELSSTGSLSFIRSSDYESPIDNDQNNVYQLTVIATNLAGTDTTQQPVSVTVSNINEAPELNIASDISVLENKLVQIQIQADDPEHDAVSIDISGEDSALFVLNDTVLSLLSPANYEQPIDANADNQFNLVITATDGSGLAQSQSLNITVEDVDERMIISGITSLITTDVEVTRGNSVPMYPNAVVNDPENNLTGQQLVVANLLAQDNINISANNEFGFTADPITRVVLLDGAPIAQLNAITNSLGGQDIALTFEHGVTNDMATSLLRQLHYHNTQQQPSFYRDYAAFHVDIEGNKSNLYDGINFQNKIDDKNPLSTVQLQSASAPAFADLNNDGLIDLLIGDKDGNVSLYLNQGTEQQGLWVLTDHEFTLPQYHRGFSPAFVDIDNDGDKDIFYGTNDGYIQFVKNNTVDNDIQLQLFNDQDNPLYGVDAGSTSSPTFVDIDNDGDFDAFIGNNAGAIEFYLNQGDANNANFVIQTESDNPAALNYTQYSLSPEFIDIDGDLDFDLVVGGNSARLDVFINHGSPAQAQFKTATIDENPFSAFSVQPYSKPKFIDIDSDNDADLVLGNYTGQLQFFENVSGLSIQINSTTNAVPIVNLVDEVVLESLTEKTVTAQVTDSDNDVILYHWKNMSDSQLTISGQDSESITISAPMVEQNSHFEIQLQVSDGIHQVTRSMLVTVVSEGNSPEQPQQNFAPDVSLSSAMSVDEGQQITISATASDVDEDQLTYSWQQTVGASVVLSGADSESVSFIAPDVSDDTVISLVLSVSDGNHTVNKQVDVSIINVTDVNTTESFAASLQQLVLTWLLMLVGYRRLYRRR